MRAEPVQAAMGKRTRRLAAGVVFLVLLLAGCRSEAERRAVAQVPEPAGSTSGAGGAGSRAPDVALRRLWAGDDWNFYAQSISPDGRYLSMVDWGTFNIMLRDLQTDQLHLLTDVRTEGESWEMPDVTVFSRDGRRLISFWDTSSGSQLRVFDLETGADGVPRAGDPTVIFRSTELEPRYPFDWSPDGRYVVAHAYTRGRTSQLLLISTDDGSHRTLKSFDWREPNRAAFSPDGRHVAYSIPTERGSGDLDVFVVAVDGTYEAPIVDGPGVDRLLGWHPSGDLLFYRDRGGTSAVWRVPTSEGRAAGPFELVKEGMLGIEPLGFAGNTFHYGLHVNPRQLYLAPVDLAAGRLAGAPLPVGDPARIRIEGWDWSTDGKFLAYSARGPGKRGSVIVIRSDEGDGDAVQSLELDLEESGQIRWAPDGRSLVVLTNDARGRRGFYRVDLKTGSYVTIVRNDELADHSVRLFEISADGRTIWFFAWTGANGDGTPWTLLAYDTESGATRSITPAEWLANGHILGGVSATQIAVSPDGTRLAIVAPDTTSSEGDRWIGTIPVDGGPFTRLAHLEPGTPGRVLQWTPDGRSLVFSTVQPDDLESGWKETWIVPAEGGDVRPLELVELFDARGLKLHPSGRRVAYLAGEPRGELWAMEGLWSDAAAEAGR